MSRLSSHLLVSNAYVNMKRKVNANARPLLFLSTAHRSQKLVTFTDTVSQVHEIPPKPKRTRHVEKRSRTVPIPPPHAKNEEQAQIQSLEQRISLTSLEDLQKKSQPTLQFDSTKNLNQKEKDDLSKVLTYNSDLSLKGQVYYLVQRVLNKISRPCHAACSF